MPEGLLAITGANGFVGRNLATLAQGRSLKLFGGRTGAEGAPPLGDGSIDLRGVEALVHLAGAVHNRLDDAAYQAVNVDLPIRLMKIAAEAGVRRFVFASSIAVHGASMSQSCGPDTPFHPPTAYGASKARAEEALAGLAPSLGIELVRVRPPMVYGPAAPGNFTTLVKAISRGLPLPFGSANNRRSFVSVRNLCDLLLHVSGTPAAAVVLPADREILSTREMCRLIGRGLRQTPRLAPVPPSWLKAAAAAAGRSGMYRSLFEDFVIDQGHWAALGWSPPASARTEIPAAAAGRPAP